MPARTRKRSKKADINRSKGMSSVEMSLDVAEWLEGERLEHERRMQELGHPCGLKEQLSEFSDKQNRENVLPKK